MACLRTTLNTILLGLKAFICESSWPQHTRQPASCTSESYTQSLRFGHFLDMRSRGPQRGNVTLSATQFLGMPQGGVRSTCRLRKQTTAPAQDTVAPYVYRTAKAPSVFREPMHKQLDIHPRPPLQATTLCTQRTHARARAARCAAQHYAPACLAGSTRTSATRRACTSPSPLHHFPIRAYGPHRHPSLTVPTRSTSPALSEAEGWRSVVRSFVRSSSCTASQPFTATTAGFVRTGQTRGPWAKHGNGQPPNHSRWTAAARPPYQ